MKKLRISLYFVAFFSAQALLSIGFDDLSEDQERLLNSLPADQREGILMKMVQAEELEEEIKDKFEELYTTQLRPQKKVLTEEELEEYRAKSKNWIFT